MKAKLLTILLLVCLALPIVLAAPAKVVADDTDYSGDEDVKAINEKVMKLINIVQYLAGGIAALLATITGIMFMQARDPSEKKQLGDRLKAILIGLGIVLLSIPIVNLLL
jgi:hypothetical protein